MAKRGRQPAPPKGITTESKNTVVEPKKFATKQAREASIKTIIQASSPLKPKNGDFPPLLQKELETNTALLKNKNLSSAFSVLLTTSFRHFQSEFSAFREFLRIAITPEKNRILPLDVVYRRLVRFAQRVGETRRDQPALTVERKSASKQLLQALDTVRKELKLKLPENG